MKILLATHNQGKIKEIRAALKNLPIRIILEEELLAANEKLLPEVIETGKTLEENAALKAKTFVNHYQIPSLADDSGLELLAEPGFPGVNSKRWFAGTDHQRNQALLNRINGRADRQAAFRTVLCLAFPNNGEEFFEGRILGEIATVENGEAGFGYDPLFIPEGYQQSFAQLGLTVKEKISHRSRALSALEKYLKNKLS
jgi:XTP/dITP diphosphohydrolase